MTTGKRRAQAAAHLLGRRAARADLGGFCEFVYKGFENPPHIAALMDRLQAVERGEVRRLIVTMPPRHGKSLTASELFPAWFLGRNPERRIIVCSYAAGLAYRFSRSVRNMIDGQQFAELFPQAGLSEDYASISAWDMRGSRGGMIAAGVGGGITGHGADLLLIDDPIKDSRTADSVLMRERIWEWFTTTAYTRLHPMGGVVVIATRWHEDDLTGRLLAGENKDDWDHLHLPAMTEDGAALWPERYSSEELERIKVQVGNRTWFALFQGTPFPASGSMFKREWFPVVEAYPAGLRVVRYWDKAASEGEGDYSAGVLMGEAGGVYYVLDVVRGQWTAGARNAIMRQTAIMDGRSTDVRIEREGGSGGKESGEISVGLLAGFPVSLDIVSGSKATRARPLAAQCEAGNVRLVKADWNAAYLDELCAFPHGAHDDQVDASSGAFAWLTLGRTTLLL